MCLDGCLFFVKKIDSQNRWSYLSGTTLVVCGCSGCLFCSQVFPQSLKLLISMKLEETKKQNSQTNNPFLVSATFGNDLMICHGHFITTSSVFRLITCSWNRHWLFMANYIWCISSTIMQYPSMPKVQHHQLCAFASYHLGKRNKAQVHHLPIGTLVVESLDHWTSS